MTTTGLGALVGEWVRVHACISGGEVGGCAWVGALVGEWGTWAEGSHCVTARGPSARSDTFDVPSVYRHARRRHASLATYLTSPPPSLSPCLPLMSYQEHSTAILGRPEHLRMGRPWAKRVPSRVADEPVSMGTRKLKSDGPAMGQASARPCR